MYKNIFKYLYFIFASLCLFVCCIAEAATMHVIYLGDTNDETIGYTVHLDIRHLQKETTRIARHTGLTKREIILTGHKNTSNQVMRALNTLNIARDDVVFFYYSGHGFRTHTKDNPWPNIVFMKEWKGMDLNFIVNRLKEKNPRLLIALSDCCNNPIPAHGAPELVRGPVAKSIQKRAASPDSLLRANYRRLFLEAQGTVIAVAAKKGHVAKSTTVSGGNYTFVFLNVLQHYTKSTAQATWVDILDTTKELLKNKQVGDYRVVLN